VIEDYTVWRFWFDVAQLAGTMAIGGYVWWDRRKKATDKRFVALEETVNGHGVSITGLAAAREKRDRDCDERLRRIADIERDVHHLPSRAEIGKLSDQIGSLTEKLGTLDGRLSGINRAVDLLNQHHLRIEP
jgi:hypothetical protein